MNAACRLPAPRASLEALRTDRALVRWDLLLVALLLLSAVLR